MPKHKHEDAEHGKPRDMTPIWKTRGYREDIANAPDTAGKAIADKKGEEAYQRAFVEEAKKNPPRVPNPDYYPNSSSAQEYIRQREQRFLPTKKAVRVPNASYMPPIRDEHRQRLEEARESAAIKQESSPESAHSSVYTASATLPPPPPSLSPGLRPPTLSNGASFAALPTLPSLRAFEPWSGPSGPANPFK